MKIILLYILYFLSVLSLIVYPVMFITGIMVFDAPGSDKKIMNWLIALLIWTYPLLVGVFIFLSYRYQSYIFALIALIPSLILLWFLFLERIIDNHQKYNSYSRDFIINQYEYIHIGEFHVVEYCYKKNVFFSAIDNIGFIGTNSGTIDIYLPQNREIVKAAKNKSGKTLFDLYIEKDQKHNDQIGKENIEKNTEADISTTKDDFRVDKDLALHQKVTHIEFSDLYSSNAYHGTLVSFDTYVFPMDDKEIPHAYKNLYVLMCSDTFSTFQDYVNYAQHQNHSVLNRYKPMGFMIPKGNTTNCFDVIHDNNTLKIQLFTNEGKKILAGNNKIRITALIKYIGKYDPNDLTISLKSLNPEDCFFHIYLVSLTENMK